MKVWLECGMVSYGSRAGFRHTRNLYLQLLANARYDYHLLYFDRPGRSSNRLDTRELDAKEKVIPIPYRLLLPLWTRFGEPALERFSGAAEVLYACGLVFPPLRRGVTIATVRGVAYLKRPDLVGPQSAEMQQTFEYARKHADYFVAVSESTRTDLLELTDIPEDRIFVVTHGIDPSFRPLERSAAREAVRKRYGVERPFVLFIGVVAHHKNVVALIRAYRQAREHCDGLDLVIGGPPGSAWSEAQALIEDLKLETYVHLIGNVAQEGTELLELYSAAELFVFPTFYEGWCAPPSESIACGTPVACSDIPSVREVVGSAGVYFDPEDEDSMAEAIVQGVSSEETRQRLSQEGVSHVALHTWERAAQRLEQVFARVSTV